MITEENLSMENSNPSNRYMGMDLMYLIDDMWKGLKRFFWIGSIIILMFAAGAFTIEKIRYRPMYEAFSTFAVNTRTAYGYTSTYYNKAVAKQLSKTFPYILTSNVLRDIVKKEFGVDELDGMISASSIEDSSVITIRVRSTDRQLAYDILQSVMTNYPSVAEYIIGETQMDIIDESGVPTTSINRNGYRQAIAAGGFLGAVVCLALLFFYAATRHTVRGEEDLKQNLSVTYLGAVPHIRVKQRTRKQNTTILMDSKEAPAAFGECMRTIRTRFIREADDANAQRILITSASEGEGKTSLAINLAISLSRQDIRVILIDADLRNPSVIKELGISLNEGENYSIVDVLQGRIEPEKALVGYGEYGVKILPGEKFNNAPGELLGSEKMDQMLYRFSKICDVVLIDSPPCGILSDSSIVARKVDGVVFVVRQDYARIDLVLEGIDNISDTGVSILGYVLNDTERGITGYGYNYGYGYGYGYGYNYGYGYGYGGYGSYGKSKQKGS